MFRSRSGRPVPLVAGAVALGVFLTGGLVTIAIHEAAPGTGEVVYFRDPVFYTYAVWTFLLLWLVGQWSGSYVTLWETLRPVFDVPDDRYDTIIDRGLALTYRLDVPLLLFLPTQIGIELLSPFSLAPGVPAPERFVFETLQLLTNLLFMVVLYLVAVHIVTVKRVLALPISNFYTAATELEPLAEFGVSAAVKYFANMAVLIFAIYFVLDVQFLEYAFGPGLIDSLGLTRLELGFSLALLGGHLLIGLLVFLLPMQLIHGRLRTAKRDRLIDLNDEYHGLFERFLGDADADQLPGRVDELDRIHDRIERTTTWPFRVPSLLKLGASSLAPVVVFLFDTL